MSFRKKPELLGSILDNILSERGYLTICKEYEIVNHWKSIAGEQLSNVSECSRVEDGVLYVKVSSSAWRQELVYLKPDLLKKIRNETGCTTIRDIVFH